MVVTQLGGGPTRTFENSAALFSRLGCADDAIANFPPTLDGGPRRRLRRGSAIYDAISLRFLTDLRKFETDETRQIELDVQIDDMSLSVRMRAMTENSLELGTHYMLTKPSLISAIASDSACMDLCVLVAQQIERGGSVKKLTRMLEDCYRAARDVRWSTLARLPGGGVDSRTSTRFVRR